MQAFLENIQAFLGRLSRGQQLALAGVVLGTVALLVGIGYWTSQPDYALLFGRLDPTDANGVVENLKSDDVPFELRENGTAVYVPRKQVHELRLRFAGEGLVSDGQVGYELFDSGTLGMTDFMQKLNLKRALEGELARTITNIGQVELARVHLVLPERNPFRDQQTEPSASVVLQMAGNSRLDSEQIAGIGALVAGAVESMTADQVTVLDTRGNMLSNPDAGNPDVTLTSTQLRLQREMEQHLAEKGQTMLDRVLGPSASIVRVSSELDFNRTVSERQLIDPESATVISEERLEEEGANDNANSMVRNYELSRTTERSESSIGDIKRLTVSVILNHRRDAPAPDAEGDDEATAPVYEPRTPAELAEVEALVKNAVGFDETRGDEFAIHQTRFDTSVDDRVLADMQQHRQQEQIQLYLRYGLMALALVLGLWLLRSATRRLTSLDGGPLQIDEPLEARSLDSGTEEEEDEEEMVLVDDVYTSKLSAEAKARLKAKHVMYEEIQQQVNEKPEQTAELLRTWLYEHEADDAKAHAKRR